MCAAPVPGITSAASSQRADDIRTIAADLFHRRGYSATTMADIAEAAGILPGSLYHHFPSKEAIALQVLHALDQELEAVGQHLHGDGAMSSEDRLRNLTADAIAASFRHAGAIRLRGYDAPSIATGLLRDAVKAQAPAFERAWKIVVQQLPARASHTPAERALLGYALRAMSLGASLQYPEPAREATLARDLCTILLHGVALDRPDDEELDRSEATAAAKEAIASWPPPITADSATDTADVIVGAARTEFARRGYEATTVRDIADAAGVTMGTLYRRFDSKEAILHQVIEPYASCVDRASRAAMSTGVSEVESVDALARVFVRARHRFRQESDILKVAWRERAEPGSPIHDYYEHTEERLRILADRLTDGIERGSIRAIAPPVDFARHIRLVLWLPFRDHQRTSERRAIGFLRSSLLRGFLE